MATLGFSTNWPKEMGGEPTYFISKIWKSEPLASRDSKFESFFNSYARRFQKPWDYKLYDADLHPKLHTIRRDSKNLWVPGRKIHMVVNNRTKDRFQFAPVLKVKSVQTISIRQIREEDKFLLRRPLLSIDGRPVDDDTLVKLAKNDGFDSPEHFFQWFKEDFKGKIIHWTDLQY